jgi:hypothetical protein
VPRPTCRARTRRRAADLDPVLYLELVQRGIVSKTRTGARRTDQETIDALTRLREAAQIPWDWIIDETRSLDDYSGDSTIRQQWRRKKRVARPQTQTLLD